MKPNNSIINHEVNFMTEDCYNGIDALEEIKNEFDLIRLWQGMNKIFGLEARSILDRYIALSLRKFLCDNGSPLVRVCPNFMMPPLNGVIFYCPGDDEKMKLVEIHTNLKVRPKSEWIPLKDWLDSRIAWIEKDKNDVPKVVTDSFFQLLSRKLEKTRFAQLYGRSTVNGQKVWKLDNPTQNGDEVYEILKNHGYYDLSIGRMIRQIADKYGAHMDKQKSLWIRMANQSSIIGISAISAFATQMIYATSKQVKGLEDYYVVNPNLEE